MKSSQLTENESYASTASESSNSSTKAPTKRYGSLWTESEKKILLKALEKYNWNDWSLMAEMVETRTASQIGDRIKKAARGDLKDEKLCALALQKKRLATDPNYTDTTDNMIEEESKEEKEPLKASEEDGMLAESSTKVSSKVIPTEAVSNSNTIEETINDKADPPVLITTGKQAKKTSPKVKVKNTANISRTPTPPPPHEASNEPALEQPASEPEKQQSVKDVAVVNPKAKKASIKVKAEKSVAIEQINSPVIEEANSNAIEQQQVRSTAPSAPASVAKPKRKYSRKVSLKSKQQLQSQPASIPSETMYSHNDEDVSIVDSSSSSDKSSINIMSSSESGDSLSSIKSRNSSKSSDSSSIVSSSSTENSLNSVELVIEDWEKVACPSIFGPEKAVTLNNPEKTYSLLKRRMIRILNNNPSTSIFKLISTCKNMNSSQSIKEVHAILSKMGIVEESESLIPTSTSKPSYRKGSQKDQELSDFELLKKLSSTSSGRKRKIRSEEGDWIDPDEIEGRVISHEPLPTMVKEKRKRRPVKTEMFSDDGILNSSEDPFRLILLNDFCGHQHGGIEESSVMSPPAPFKVEICTSVILLMDLHSHLHSSEIIGLLGGTFIKSDSDSLLPVLRIDHGYPCLTVHSTGTQVDVDPLSEMEAGEYFERKNVRMAGWYHSHPNFEPNPSLRDLETQSMYQALFRNSQPNSTVEPFVGVIVNPYLAITESSSHVECFYVVVDGQEEGEGLPYRLPINQVSFDPESFPIILEQMREIIQRADSSPDRLDMHRNAQPGHKRIDKLFASLQFHGQLTSDQLDQIKQLL